MLTWILALEKWMGRVLTSDSIIRAAQNEPMPHYPVTYITITQRCSRLALRRLIKMQSGSIDQCCYDNNLPARYPGEKSVSFLLHEVSDNRPVPLIGARVSRGQCISSARSRENRRAGVATVSARPLIGASHYRGVAAAAEIESFDSATPAINIPDGQTSDSEAH